MSDKFAILRLTVKVDMNDTKETLFARAMLRRLNVLFAKCRPKGGLLEILSGSKLSDAYSGSQTIGKSVEKPVKKHTYFSVVKSPEVKKPESIQEQSMQPPVIEAEIVET
jgi:hypothetical protein